MAAMEIFPIFCTVDVSSELLTTYLLQAHEPMREGTVDDFEQLCVILRSPDLASVTDRTPIPTSGIFPQALKSPFPNWTSQQVHDYLKLHAPGTKIHKDNFVIIDARSLVDYTCEIADNSIKFSETKSMRATGHVLRTVRATFRDSILTLVNLDIANTDIEEVQMNIKGGLSMVGETEEGRKKDLEGATLAETVLRSGKVPDNLSLTFPVLSLARVHAVHRGCLQPSIHQHSTTTPSIITLPLQPFLSPTLKATASRYIPPHLQNKSGSSQDESKSATANADSNQLLQRPLQDLKLSSADENAGYSVDEIATHYNNDQLGVASKASTLHSSASKPHELVYVLLFRNANPRWESDQIIFAKTNIDLLPGYSDFKASTDGGTSTAQVDGATKVTTSSENPSLGASDGHHRSPTSDHPANSATEETQVTTSNENDTSPLIPVFTERSYRRFTFSGYFHIINVDFLAPGSAALIRMLEQKWAPAHNSGRGDQRTGTKQRNPEKWAKSLRLVWAVVKMGKVEESGLEEPKIGRVEVV